MKKFHFDDDANPKGMKFRRKDDDKVQAIMR